MILEAIIAKIVALVPIENITSDFWGTITEPFTDLMDNWYYATVLALLVGGVYIKTESYGPPLAVMLAMSGLFTAVIDSPVRYFFAVLAGLAAAGILYVAYRGGGR